MSIDMSVFWGCFAGLMAAYAAIGVLELVRARFEKPTEGTIHLKQIADILKRNLDGEQ